MSTGNEKPISDKEAYRMLYKFLKKNCIFDKYIANIIRSNPHRKKENSKKILLETVSMYKTSGMGGNFINLFNYAPGSFYWDQSYEGANFWIPFFGKWNDFRKKYLNESYEL